MKKKIIGQIKSKTTNRIYDVYWDEDEGESWICICVMGNLLWELVCRKVYSVENALMCSQKLIDSQPMTY